MNTMIENTQYDGRQWATEGTEYPARKIGHAFDSLPSLNGCGKVVNGQHCGQAEGSHVESTEPARPAVAELAAAGTGPSARRVTSRAHKAPLTPVQVFALSLAADNASPLPGRVFAGHVLGRSVSVATLRALANKGYGRTLTASEVGFPGRRHQVVAFEINDLGRRALAELDA